MQLRNVIVIDELPQARPHPEHGLSEGLLLAEVVSEPVQDQLAEVSEVDETIPPDVVGDINHCLLRGIQSQALHSQGQILISFNNGSLLKSSFYLQRGELFLPPVGTLK